MTYYAALQAAWATSSASSGALPSGVTGTSLFGLATAAKIAAVNGWTVTGSVPTTLYVTGVQLLNCINWTEFAALTAVQQQNLLWMCAAAGPQGLLLGGSSNTGFVADGMFLAYFTNHSGPTVLALTALAQGLTQPWWQANGYSSAFNASDITVAGLT